MNTRRFATIGSALIVAAIAAYASYSHMRHLALTYGQDRTVATLLPLSVDGLMVVATIALGDGRRHRWSAWLAFWAGVAASVIANVLAAEPSGVARTISAWPAIAFLLVVEVITRGGRIRPSTEAAEVATLVDSSQQVGLDTSAVTVADTTPPVKRAPARTARRTEPRPAGRPSSAPKVVKTAAKMPDATRAEIAAKAGVSAKTVRRHLPDKTPDSAADKTPDAEPDTTPINGHAVDLAVADR